MQTYYPPVLARTGERHSQPHANETLSGWYFDRDLNYTETSFLDAPCLIPSGSVRGLVCGGITVGISHTYRG